LFKQKDAAMRILYPVIVIYIVSALSGCSTFCSTDYSHKNTAVITNKEADSTKHPPKDPAMVTLYKQGNPQSHYKVIGKGIISKYNLGGIKRQEGLIHDALRDIAASMGGDAVIDIKKDDRHVIGTVITYGA
jgi:hypothetical protein